MDYVFEIHNNISPEICEEMITLFEKDDGKEPGVTGSNDPKDPVKRSLDLQISNPDHKETWGVIDKYLCTQLTEGIRKYIDHIHTVCGVNDNNLAHGYDTGYQIQRTDAGGYYSWHHDQCYQTRRVMTFIWYLNDIDITTDGGATAFHPKVGGGGLIKPEQGKLLLFPATWTYTHSGLPFVNAEKSKYICTGWIHIPDKPK
jgi:Rps23 Pro-64 3,4-dihydroxylase Tpa1-like proline 4-hydroxylase